MSRKQAVLETVNTSHLRSRPLRLLGRALAPRLLVLVRFRLPGNLDSEGIAKAPPEAQLLAVLAATGWQHQDALAGGGGRQVCLCA